MRRSAFRSPPALAAAVVASLLGGCALRPPAAPHAEVGTGVAVAGWEGFHRRDLVDDAWLAGRGIALPARSVRLPAGRVVKLVLADGSRTATADQRRERLERYCSNDARAWNEELCASLESAVCTGGSCTWDTFGNCSGFLHRGAVLTAAHCAEGAAADPKRAAASRIVVPGADGRPAQRIPFGRIVLGKRDFTHDFVSIDEENPLDAARIEPAGALGSDAAAGEWETAPVPERGGIVFILGYPRSERRPAEAMRRAAYGPVYGTPSASFGRVADRNEAGAPLCAVDEYQEHWQLRGTCPAGRSGEGWKGPVTQAPFLATFDTMNGYSGAPVFDSGGRLVGINVTILGGVNPQEEFSDSTRAVVTPVQRVLQWLETGANRAHGVSRAP